jgi:hypothetical protein
MNEKCITKGIKTFSFYDSCLKEFSIPRIVIVIVVIDKYYYQLKQMHFFLLHPVCELWFRRRQNCLDLIITNPMQGT